MAEGVSTLRRRASWVLLHRLSIPPALPQHRPSTEVSSSCNCYAGLLSPAPRLHLLRPRRRRFPSTANAAVSISPTASMKTPLSQLWVPATHSPLPISPTLGRRNSSSRRGSSPKSSPSRPGRRRPWGSPRQRVSPSPRQRVSPSLRRWVTLPPHRLVTLRPHLGSTTTNLALFLAEIALLSSRGRLANLLYLRRETLTMGITVGILGTPFRSSSSRGNNPTRTTSRIIIGMCFRQEARLLGTLCLDRSRAICNPMVGEA